MLAAVVGLCICVVSVGASKPHAPPETAAGLEYYAGLVEELELRRRVNVLFPNPQTLFDGLEAGFVNVSTGNLTFRRRDIVVGAAGPVVFARVHDSRIRANPEFGPGWRLSLAEELFVDDDTVIHVDNAGARYRFMAGGDGYIADPPTHKHAGSHIVLAADGRIAALREADGTERVFERSARDRRHYRIVQVQTGERKLHFRYADGLLWSVAVDGETLFRIRRGGRGGALIRAVTDVHGRTVHYSYTQNGHLNDVVDLAGNVWSHEYNAAGRLISAVGPNGKPYLEVRYDMGGRVVESRTGREFLFSYGRTQTTVTEVAGQQYVFERNEAGATVAMRSTSGAKWRLSLDAFNRVEELTTPDAVLRYSYASDGAPVEIVEETATGKKRNWYAYDGAGRLKDAASDDGGAVAVAYADGRVQLTGEVEFDYDLSPGGDVTAVRDHDARIHAEYDSSGALTALFRDARGAYFTRDAAGRVIGTGHPSGDQARYFYDDLGNRRMAEYDRGGSVRYRHDAAGNIVEVEVASADGAVKRQRVTVGSMNRVEQIDYEDAYTLRIGYDGMGRPVQFDTGGDVISAEYDQRGALKRLVSKATAAEWKPAGEDAAPPPDSRRAVLSGDPLGARHPDYGVVAFAEATFEALPRNPLERGVPGLAAARALRAVASPLFCCWPYHYFGHDGGEDEGEDEDDCEGVTAIVAPPNDSGDYVDINGLTDGTQTALSCLSDAVGDNGGSLVVISAYRSSDYQDHIQEVWDKHNDIEDWPETQCSDVRSNVILEWKRHRLNAKERPANDSQHSSGSAFDAYWGTLNQGVSIDELASRCGLVRPLPDSDPNHFVH